MKLSNVYLKNTTLHMIIVASIITALSVIFNVIHVIFELKLTGHF